MADRPLSIDVREPTLIKGGELFLVAQQDGTVPRDVPGMGLFYRDCRYLAHYELRLHGIRPLLLMSSAELGFAATIELTNGNFKTANGVPIAQHTLAIRRRRAIIEADGTLVEWIRFRNFHPEPMEVPLSLAFEASFDDIFALRGQPPGERGTLHRPDGRDGRLGFAYSGADGVLRRLEVRFSVPPLVAPRTTERTFAHFTVELGPQQAKDIVVTLRPEERRDGGRRPPARAPAAPTVRRLASYRRQTAERWLDGFAAVRSDCPALDEAIRRSLGDIRLLRIRREAGSFVAAGIPWFAALFGRDSLIPSLQCLAFDPEIAAETLRLLARWQGDKDDPSRKEQPGKILHELRVGEMAHLGEVPQTPSYGSIDSTILFLILMARHAAWTGDVALFRELGGNVDRALAWMRDYGDADGDGYIEYSGCAGGLPVNQGWKDSQDGIVRRDGSFPTPPIALAEVQGYAYLAKTGIAELYRRVGDAATADRLTAEAADLRRRFNRDFWMADEGCYCLALEDGNRPVRAVASNAGQALWSGIAEVGKARRAIRRLMQGDMFSGWGVRTLSADSVRYNPLAYHLGSVWPFDNSLILGGFRRYGGDGPALRLFAAALDAAGHFPYSRLPEFFAGTDREPGAAPPHCPRADPLQAWTAGALPSMLTALLGLLPDGFGRRLRAKRPVLPAAVHWLELHGVRIGGGSLDLRFERNAANRIEASMLRATGGACFEAE